MTVASVWRLKTNPKLRSCSPSSWPPRSLYYNLGSSQAGWKTKLRSHPTAKNSLSILLATQIVPSSTPSPVICLFALSDRAGWRTWKRQSQFSAKHSLSVLLATQIDSSPSTISPMICLLAFSSQGKMEDLEAAISFHREVLALRPLGPPRSFQVPQQPCQ